MEGDGIAAHAIAHRPLTAEELELLRGAPSSGRCLVAAAVIVMVIVTPVGARIRPRERAAPVTATICDREATMSTPETTHHVRWDAEERTVLALLRLRYTDDALYGESFRPDEGWVESAGAFDVCTNGQDYDLVDAEEAERLASRMAAGEI